MKALLSIFLALSLVGCALPSSKAAKRLKAVEQAQSEIAKADVFGTGVALDSVPASPATDVAVRLNTRAGLALGSPKPAEALSISSAVAAHLSGDPAAEKVLSRGDVELAKLQNRLDRLGETLEKREEKRDSDYLASASLADVWVKLKRWVYLLLAGVAILLLGPPLFRLLGLLVPATGPIANLFASVFARAGKTILKAVPAAAEKAGYVATEKFSATQEALEDTVTAIQRARQDDEVRPRLEAILNDVTDEGTSRPTIRETKQRLNLRKA